MKKIVILIIVNFIVTTTYSQSFDGNLGSKSLFWTMEQKNFESLPRVGIPPMSMKLWDNYNNTASPSQYGSLLEINGRVNHLVSQLYFSGNWDNGRIQYRSAFYNQSNWQDWRYLLDSKNDIETSGNLKINGSENSYILNGKLGIGTADPETKLSVNGNSTIIAGYGGWAEGLNIDSPNGIWGGLKFRTIGRNGKNGNWHLGYDSVHSGTTLSGNNIYLYNGSNDLYVMTYKEDGNVGIGTMNPDEKLTVNGKIHAKEVRIDLAYPMTVPDYVFANDYKLKSLQEVEKFIKQNSHLPEIPSAKEIEKNGLMLAEMNMSLLKKIEELTLYSIAQEKKINTQAQEIESSKSEIQILKKENQAFKSLSERLSKLESQLKK